MPFLFNETADTPPARSSAPKARTGGHIPIHSMRELGCRACPSDKDTKLKHAKMEPLGPAHARVYILLPQPSSKEDKTGKWLDDRAGDTILDTLDRAGYTKTPRVYATARCYQGAESVWQKPEIGPTECCRGFIERDIEMVKPSVIIGIGDAALAWATKFNKGIPFRGTPMALRIGNHTCWFVSALYPNFAFKEKWANSKPSEWELTFFHDIKLAVGLIDKEPPVVYLPPYDGGIEIITGTSAGDFNRLEDAFNALVLNPRNGLDYETSGLRPHYLRDPAIWTAAIGTFERTYAFSVDHPEGWATERKQREVRGLLGDFLLHSPPKICHHLGFELEWTNYFYGELVLRLTDWEDTMALANTLDERCRAPKKEEYDATAGGAGLGAQTRIHFGFDVKKQSNIDPAKFLDYPLRDVLRYNGMDTKWTHRLFEHVRPIVAEVKAYDWEYERKVRLAPTLVLTMDKGVPVDQEYARKMNDDLEDRSREISRKIDRCPEVIAFKRKHQFNPSNDDDVLALMKYLDRPEIRREERDRVRWTTDVTALSEMPRSEVPCAPLILEKRGLEKLRGTYLGPIAAGKHICTDGRMRTIYGSMVAVTGRLNSEEPNLQNFPKRKHREVRGMIYAPEGQWLAALDYGQIEARVFAMASGDEALIKALWTAYDIHGWWADYYLKHQHNWADYLSEEYEIDRGDAKKIRKAGRDVVKNGWVFPQFFGSSIKSCAEDMHIDIEVVEAAGEIFWDEFRGVKKWQNQLIHFYEKNLYVETLTGRRRRGPMTKNELLNHPIQGTAADIVTDAMDRLSVLAFLEGDPELQPNLNVHDDLTSLLADQTLEAKIKRIATVMCEPQFKFINVPIIVEASVGARWHKLEEIAVYRSNELFNIPNPYDRKVA